MTNPSESNSDITLVESGEPTAEIRWGGDGSSRVAPFAAKELQNYLESITGITVPVVEADSVDIAEDESVESVVLVDAAGDRSRVSLTPVERAVADTAPDTFMIRGTDEEVLLAGTTHRGTLYAVYALLEQLGVRFFAPRFPFYDGHAEFVPERSTVTVTSQASVEEPSFEYRRKWAGGIAHTPQTLPILIDWLAKTRHNIIVVDTDYADVYGLETEEAVEEALLDPLRRRGLILEAGGHNFQRYLSPEDYSESHPEWFSEDYNVFNIDIEPATETLTRNIIEELRDKPEIEIFEAWPPDGASWPPHVVEEFGSVANAYAYVVNRINDRINDEFPDRDISVEAIAYSSHIRPPDPEYMYSDDVIIDFAPNGQDRSIRIPTFEQTGEETKEGYDDWLRAWRESFNGTIAIYEYYRRYSWHSLPVLLPELISQEIPYYERVGANGIGIYSEPADWITYELTHLLVAAMAWNTDLDVDSYVDTYLENRYGAEAETVREYVSLVEEGSRTLLTSQKEALRGRQSDVDNISTALEKYRLALDQLEEARSGCDDKTARFLLDRLCSNAEFAIADTEINYYEAQNELEQAESARERTSELIESHQFDGVILNSRWTAYKTEQRDLDHDAYDRQARERYRQQW